MLKPVDGYNYRPPSTVSEGAQGTTYKSNNIYYDPSRSGDLTRVVPIYEALYPTGNATYYSTSYSLTDAITESWDRFQTWAITKGAVFKDWESFKNWASEKGAVFKDWESFKNWASEKGNTALQTLES